MGALNDILGFAGKTADAVLLGGTVGKTKRRNAFADMLESGDYQGAEQLALRNGEGAYAQLAQQRGQAQTGAAQKRQQDQAAILGRIAQYGDSLPAEARLGYAQSIAPILQSQFDLDEEDVQAIMQAAQVPQGFGALAAAFIDPNQQIQNDFKGQELGISQQNADTSRMNALKPQAPLVSVNTGATESAFQKKVGEVQASQYGDIQTAATSAQQQIQQAEALKTLIDEGVKTGRLEAATLPVKQFAASVGIDVEGLPGQEAYRALTNQLALRLRNPDSGMGLTGNTSNRDVTFLKDSVPGLEKSQQGNKLLLDMYLQVQRRKIIEAQLAESYAMQRGSLNGFREYMTDYNDRNPIFDEEFKARVGNIARGGAQEPAQQENVNDLLNYMTPEERALFDAGN